MVTKEQISTKKEQVKKHFVDNKKFYIGAAAGLTVGIIATAIVRQRPIIVNNIIAPEFAPVFNNSLESFKGTVSKVVQNLDTKEIFGSITEAAAAEQVPTHAMSRHVNGLTDAVNGNHYKIIGLGVS